MRIELKSIKHYPSMSEETECYEADLWVDGVKIGHVSNRGTGGCDDFHGDWAAFERADAWCKANLPKWGSEFDGADEHESDLEMHCANLLQDWLVEKDMLKALRTKTVFVKPGEKGLFTIAYKGKKAPDPALYASVRSRYPGAIILNEMAQDEALKLYLTHGGA